MELYVTVEKSRRVTSRDDFDYNETPLVRTEECAMKIYETTESRKSEY